MIYKQQRENLFSKIIMGMKIMDFHYQRVKIRMKIKIRIILNFNLNLNSNYNNLSLDLEAILGNYHPQEPIKMVIQ